MTPSTHEIRIEIALTPRLAWFAAALFFLAFPRDAGTGENIIQTTYYTSPAGIYNKLLVTGDAAISQKGGVTAFIINDATDAAPGRVGLGVTSPAEKLHVRGNLRVSGCIHLKNHDTGAETVRCSW